MHRLARQAALAAALTGGICWVANLWADAPALSWVGAALLAVAAGLVGSGLARLAWVAVVAGLGAVALAGALVEAARDLGDARVVEAVLGAAAALAVGIAVLRRDPHPQPAGNHRA